MSVVNVNVNANCKYKCGVIGAYHIKAVRSVNLDDAMEPAEQDRHG